MHSRKTQTIMTLAALVMAPFTAWSQTSTPPGGGSGQQVPARVSLRVAPGPCAAVSPQGSFQNNPNPSDVNDGDLDDSEIEALQSGCTLSASVTDQRGRPLPGVPLRLVRTPAVPEFGVGTQIFGQGRTTDSRGQASWGFPLTANTDFIYEAFVNDRNNRVRLVSNTVEIQLCTGDDSVDFIPDTPTNDAGLGCPDNGDGDDDNDIDVAK